MDHGSWIVEEDIRYSRMEVAGARMFLTTKARRHEEGKLREIVFMYGYATKHENVLFSS
jgi:hypothetical protein